MALNYKTSDGDVVDYIAWQHYGVESPAVLRAVYDANPGLADYGPVLPHGLTIVLPDISQPSTISAGVSLWN
jgi:phage tail protein X